MRIPQCAARGVLAVWTRILSVSILTLPACLAQPHGEWEIGVTAGYGIYHNGSVIAPAGTAEVGVRNRFTVGALFAENMWEHLSGEFRYTYQDGDPFVSGRGIQQNVQGQSHTFNYDLLVHIRDREQRVRPYFAGGGGAKLYRVSGPPPIAQPLADIVVLTTRDDWRPVFSIGGGVKVRVHRHMVLSFDFRDFITTFPKDLFVAAPFGTPRGIFHQFTPMVGVSYSY